MINISNIFKILFFYSFFDYTYLIILRIYNINFIFLYDFHIPDLLIKNLFYTFSHKIYKYK